MSIPTGHVISEGITSSDFNVDQKDMTDSRFGVSNFIDESVRDDDAIRQVIVDPPLNLEEIVEEEDFADHLFVGFRRKLSQWSVSQGKVTHDYGDIMDEMILSMVKTSDKKSLFVSDLIGH